jgi:two-component system, OmpR family, response regulator
MNAPTSLRILVIEDDLRMVELLRTGLREKGHTPVTATSAEEGEQLIDAYNFDAIVLDIGLPGRSGYSVAQHLSGRAKRPAIVMLTALGQEDNVVFGLDAGADDYLAKPFSFPELVARISSAARRTWFAAEDRFCFGPFELDTRTRRLFSNRTEIHITQSEYLLLYALALNCGETVPRRRLMQAVWGEVPMSHGALDSLVNSLRAKLNEGQPGLISTIRGRGYSLAGNLEPGRMSAP